MTEEEIKKRFVSRAKRDFIIHAEVPGNHLIEKKTVKIDYLIYPREHLIDRGFDAAWVGIEVKFLSEYKLGKLSKFAWQAISYGQSEFRIGEKKIRPLFIAMHSNVTFNLQKGKDIPENLTGLLGFLEYANVGWFEFDRTYIWRIGFGSHGYFNKRNGKNSIKNMGIKRNVGNLSR